jgi:hypothetical protein
MRKLLKLFDDRYVFGDRQFYLTLYQLVCSKVDAHQTLGKTTSL